MTTHKNITRILAVLLAVLLFGQLAAFQIPAFAADVVPDVHDGAAYIPAGADVNDLLSQTLLSNYSDVGCQEWEYKATSTLSGGATKWVPVTGTTAGIIPSRVPEDKMLETCYQALHHQLVASAMVVKDCHEIIPGSKVGCRAAVTVPTAIRVGFRCSRRRTPSRSCSYSRLTLSTLW